MQKNKALGNLETKIFILILILQMQINVPPNANSKDLCKSNRRRQTIFFVEIEMPG